MGKTEVVWAESALREVDAIGSYIAADSIEAANLFVEGLLSSVERLQQHPLSGQIISENPGFRHVVFKGYRVIYRIVEEVEIVAVIAPGRDAGKILPIVKK